MVLVMQNNKEHAMTPLPTPRPTRQLGKTKKSIKLSPVTLTVIMVSLFWLLIAGTILAYVEHGHASYDKGVFDGISKTKMILQGK